MLLPEFGVKRPVTNLMIFCAAIMMGLVSIYFLPIDLMPKIEPPAISVITVYPGASAEDVETKITMPVENDLSIITNLNELVSFSRENTSAVTCKFDWGTDLDEAANNIRARLEFTKLKLPDDSQEPMIIKFDTSMIPILGLGVTAKESWEKLHHLVDTKISDALKRVPGVGAVQTSGGLEREIHVELDQHKMTAYGLSVKEIETALRNNNITVPAGSLKIGQNEYMLRMPGEFQEVDEIGRTVVKVSDSRIVYLKDVALVSDSFKEIKRNIIVDGTPGMLVMVQKQSGANTVEVTKAVREKLKIIEKTLPDDVQINEMFNTAKFVEQTISNLTDTVLWGGLLVILVTIFFLREIRGSLIITLTIPFSLVVAFIFIYAFGMTINLMSLGSLAIAIGMVVDNAIVVLENTHYHIGAGKSPHEAAIFGASEVGLAVSASTLTTIVVFVPLIFMKGISGIMFKELGIAVIVVLLASLLTSLTMTPMLASRLLKPVSTNYKPNWIYAFSENIFTGIERFYGRVLEWAMQRRLLIVVLSIIIFAGPLMLIKFIGTEFLPAEDTGDLWVTVELPVGTKVEKTLEVSQELEKIFYEEAGKDIRHIFTQAGQSEFAGGGMGFKEGPNVMTIGAKLISIEKRSRRVEEIGQAIRAKLNRIPGIVKIAVDSGNPLNRILLGAAKPLTVEIIGEDMDVTNRFAAEVREVMLNTKGASDPTISRDIAKPEILIEIDPDKAAQFGLNKAVIGQTLRTYFYGSDTVKFRTGRKEYNILVNLKPEDRLFVENVRDISIPSPTGVRIPLTNVAVIKDHLGMIEIERQNQERIVRVSSNVYGRSLGEVAQDIEKGMARLVKPDGVDVKIGGLVKEQRKSFTDMKILLVLSVLLVYMVMASQFESLLHPFVIMFSVPFAFTGVFLALFLGGYHLSLITILGGVLLIGVAVNNAIVLIDYINILRGRGVSLTEAIKQSGMRRLRPILMTSLTTIFGLIPMAFSGGEGSESWRPLGLVILSGLTVSMVVTLVLVPVIYSLVSSKQGKDADFISPAPDRAGGTES